MADKTKSEAAAEYEQTAREGNHGVEGLAAGMNFAPPLVPKDAEKSGAAAVVHPDSEVPEAAGATQPASDTPKDQTVRTTRAK